MRILNIILCFVLGCGALWAGITAKAFYQKPLGGHQLGPQVPTWFGRSITILIGLALLYGAVWNIRHR
jgi:hypothetical protein